MSLGSASFAPSAAERLDGGETHEVVGVVEQGEARSLALAGLRLATYSRAAARTRQRGSARHARMAASASGGFLLAVPEE